MSTNVPGQPEYLGPAGPTDSTDDAAGGPPRGRRTGIVAAVALAVAAAIGAGTYGLVQLMSGGAAAASAVPASAIGFVSIDLDPSASQKIEAIKILRKFPALKKETNIGSRDDVRRAVFDGLVKSGDCSGLDYEQDVKPWIGQRLGVAAMPDEKDIVSPLVVVQVSDQTKAKAGFDTLRKCGDDQDATDASGVSFVGDYMLVAQTQKSADAMAKDASTSSLADDEDYQSWMERAGDPGIITMYAAPGAGKAVIDGIEREGAAQPDEAQRLESVLKDFRGAAGVIRFADGAVEAEFTSKGLPQGVGAVTGTAGPDVGTLPATTAAAFSLAFRDGWLDDLVTGVRDGMGGDTFDEMVAQGERATGLQLPDDIETVLGDGASLSVDAAADLEALTTAPDPTTVPAGIRISGDPAAITPVIDKLKRAAGPDADILTVRSGDGVVVLGTDKAYVDMLLKKGGLGSVAAFKDVVPQADRATGVFYVNFDAGDGWADNLADLLSDGDPEVKANVRPLDAFGVSSWQDATKVQHALLRLTTD